VLKIPTNLPLDAAAPLLCAGITVYSPMKHFQMDVPGKHFGVVGLGGLGHMAVKFGKAFGMTVTVFSTSPAKEKEARAVLGADHFIVSKDPEQMKVKKKKLKKNPKEFAYEQWPKASACLMLM
jgi:cinnamyl-alcohol dehydrogenase